MYFYLPAGVSQDLQYPASVVAGIAGGHGLAGVQFIGQTRRIATVIWD